MPGFRHEVLLHGGEPDFHHRVLAFLREGIAAREPTMALVSAVHVRSLRAALGADADAVHFADMEVVGQNPARIIPAWQQFLDEHGRDGRRCRGVGELLSVRRDPTVLEECEIHEALLNVAFADAGDWWLLCPYDEGALPADVIERARTNHPYVWRDGVHDADACHHPRELTWPPRTELPEPPADARTYEFSRTTSLHAIRGLIESVATAIGWDGQRRDDLVLAVHELVTNTLRHGGGRGVLRVWRDEHDLFCEVSDHGRIADPLVGRRAPDPTGIGGRGLWIANQVCDLVQIRQRSDGLTVRARIAIDPSPVDA